MTDELDDFEPSDCQTVGRVIDPWEMLRLLRTINALVAERNTKTGYAHWVDEKE